MGMLIFAGCDTISRHDAANVYHGGSNRPSANYSLSSFECIKNLVQKRERMIQPPRYIMAMPPC